MRLLNPRNGGAGRGAGRAAGMALVVVLLFLATLAAVAVRITQDARALVLQTRNVTRGVEARAALAAGLDVATQLVRLDRVPRDGRLAWTEGRTRIEVRVERESGKVDLNAADPGLVEALMAAALPKDLDRATALAGAAVDWRDTNARRASSELVIPGVSCKAVKHAYCGTLSESGRSRSSIRWFRSDCVSLISTPSDSGLRSNASMSIV